MPDLCVIACPSVCWGHAECHLQYVHGTTDITGTHSNVPVPLQIKKTSMCRVQLTHSNVSVQLQIKKILARYSCIFGFAGITPLRNCNITWYIYRYCVVINMVYSGIPWFIIYLYYSLHVSKHCMLPQCNMVYLSQDILILLIYHGFFHVNS